MNEENLIVIRPGRASGEMSAPPSKSAAHRLLICAGLANGKSVVRGVEFSEDVSATLDCLRALGAQIAVKGTDVHLLGIPFGSVQSSELYCRESGSTLRFFLPIALLFNTAIFFHGSKKLFERPLTVYELMCKDQDLLYTRRPDGLVVCGRLSPWEFDVPGDLSSQFISGLLFALPLLDGDSTITVRPPFESRPYVDMTLEALRAFGVQVEDGGKVFTVRGGQRYRPGDVTVEGDWSGAAFFEALGALGGDVRLTGLDPDSLQGDKVCVEYFKRLKDGCPTLDLSACPDLGPVCMALAGAFHGALFTGTKRLRYKESDRVACMAEELEKFGVKTEAEEDRVRVYGGLRAPTGALDGHNDHRIVMALSVLLTLTGGAISGYGAVKKSMPDFFERLQKLGIEVEKNGMDQ